MCGSLGSYVQVRGEVSFYPGKQPWRRTRLVEDHSFRIIVWTAWLALIFLDSWVEMMRVISCIAWIMRLGPRFLLMLQAVRVILRWAGGFGLGSRKRHADRVVGSGNISSLNLAWNIGSQMVCVARL